MTTGDWYELTGKDGPVARIDLAVGEFLLRYGGLDAPEVFAAGVLASRALRDGYSCCRLDELAGNVFPPEAGSGDRSIRLPALPEWLAVLRSAAAVRVVAAPGAEPIAAPLVLDAENRLYLQRYFGYEETVARAAAERCRRAAEPPVLSPGRLSELVPYFRAAAGSAEVDRQQQAVFTAASGAFTVITGGPGTGKTTVVAALLALELERDPGLAVMLAAPTGKAQARLRESLDAGITSLALDETRRERLRHLPCGTIHALLRPDRDGAFRFGPDRPLPCRLLIVDEASMVPLALMAQLLRALTPECRVVLLGDRDQLSSVEAGAVLADLCDAGSRNVLPPEVAAAFARQTRWNVAPAADDRPLSGHLAELTVNHRFDRAVHIGNFSRAIRELEPDGVEALAGAIAGADFTDFRTRDPGTAELPAALAVWLAEPSGWMRMPELVRDGGEEALAEAFDILENFKILAAVRRGPRGVEALNEAVRRHFGWLERYAPGLPVMIARNDRDTGLVNGDVGLVWPDRDGGVRVRFPGVERSFAPVELPEHETVFAMTVHKSQGSGFRRVLLVLPEADSPLLTRELLYTGITRAARELELWAAPAAVAAALARRTVRHSGLAARLAEAWQPGVGPKEVRK